MTVVQMLNKTWRVAKRPTRLEQESHRMLFFIVAQLIMGSMIWLVFQETFTRRPWKDHQLGWYEVERGRAEKNLASEQAFLADPKNKGRVEELEKHIAGMEGSIIDSPRRLEFEKLKKDLAAAEVKLKDKEILVAFAKADEDEQYYYYRDAKHHNHPEDMEKFAKKVADAQAIVAQRSKEYDEQTAVRDGISDKLAVIQGDLVKSKKELETLKEGVIGAQRAVDSLQQRFTGIEQFWNQDIDLVDRCHTCHMGFDKCGYSAPQEIVKTVIDEGLDQEGTKRRFCLSHEESKRYFDAATEIKDSWGTDDVITFEKVKEKLKLEEDPLLVAAKRAKISEENAEQLYRTHPHDRALLSKHPPQVYGCTTCHYGQGRQTKGVGLNLLAGFTGEFDHGKHDHYWEHQILDTKSHRVEASCFNCHKNDYELPYADHLTKGRKIVQHLGCTGCHPLGVLDPERKHGPSLEKMSGKIEPGWALHWIQNPHQIRPRTRMPNFWPTGVTKDGKIDPNANNCDVFDYAKGAPFSPARDKNCAEVRDEESAYMLAYLEKHSKEDTYGTIPASASAERGKQTFEEIGCLGCHNMGEWNSAASMPGSTDRDLAPNLSGIGDKIKNPGWFFAWVKNPKSYWHDTRMPQLRLSDTEAWDVAAYLSTVKSGQEYSIPEKIKTLMESEHAEENGKKLIAYYGCFGCHDIAGFETMARIGADLTEFGDKLTSKLDFGDVPEFTGDHHAQTWEAWTRTKLKTPRIYRYERASVRMPQFDVTPEEIELAMIFLKSQNATTKRWPSQVLKNQTPQEAAVQRGAFMIDVYNCTGCHVIDKRGIDLDGDHLPDGGDIYRHLEEEERFRAPPKLIRQGAKAYPDWMFSFLKAPYKLRENYKLRMPTFQFTDDQAKDLVAYFAAKAGKPYPFVEKKHDTLSAEDAATAEKLFAEAQCTNCHNLGGVVSDPKNVAPNLRLAAQRLQYDWLFDWLKNPQEQAPGVGMPNFFAPIDDKPGEYETPLTDIANGDWKRQIELLRAYIIELGRDQPVKQAAANTEDKPSGGSGRKTRTRTR